MTLAGTLPLSFLSCRRVCGSSDHLHCFYNLTSFRNSILYFIFSFKLYLFIYHYNILQSQGKFSTFGLLRKWLILFLAAHCFLFAVYGLPPVAERRLQRAGATVAHTGSVAPWLVESSQTRDFKRVHVPCTSRQILLSQWATGKS